MAGQLIDELVYNLLGFVFCCQIGPSNGSVVFCCLYFFFSILILNGILNTSSSLTSLRKLYTYKSLSYCKIVIFCGTLIFIHFVVLLNNKY